MGGLNLNRGDYPVNMKTWLIGIVLFAATSGVQATLIDRGSGLIYDDVLEVTWLQDTNYAQTSGSDSDGLMTWSEAFNWADNLEYGGYSNWRLPSAINYDGSGGPYNTWNQNKSELGHLFYEDLGGTAVTTGIGSTGANLYPFLNIKDDLWYTGHGSSVGGDAPFWALEQRYDRHWYFAFSNGSQWRQPDSYAGYAWAVRDGDVAPVPEPHTLALMGLGLAGVGFSRRKKKYLAA